MNASGLVGKALARLIAITNVALSSSFPASSLSESTTAYAAAGLKYYGQISPS
jgi:hypothetical protein